MQSVKSTANILSIHTDIIRVCACARACVCMGTISIQEKERKNEKSTRFEKQNHYHTNNNYNEKSHKIKRKKTRLIVDFSIARFVFMVHLFQFYSINSN